MAAVLATRYRTLKSEGNANNEIGLPLTVLRMGPEHEAAVLEMGMYVGGEIAALAEIAMPRIGVVTSVLGVHLSRIGSIDAVEKAKGELVEALPADGVAVLNADDERVRRMSARTAARTITYGFAPEADVSARDVVSAGADGMRFTLVGGRRLDRRFDARARTPWGPERPRGGGRRARGRHRPRGDRRRARESAGRPTTAIAWCETAS